MTDNDFDDYTDDIDPDHYQRRRRAPRATPAMTAHLPIRFPEDVIVQIKALASADGVTVSNWIRTAVKAEVERRGGNGRSGPSRGLSGTLNGDPRTEKESPYGRRKRKTV